MVPDLLRQQLKAVDLLASLELTLAYGPIATGRFKGTMLAAFGLTLDKVPTDRQPAFPVMDFNKLSNSQMVKVLGTCQTLAQEAALLLQRYDPARRARVAALQQEVNEARVQARATYIACRNRLHRDMATTTSMEDRMRVFAPDDAIRFQSFMWAVISAVNQVQVCCNVVLHQCKDKGPVVIPFL